MVTKPNFHDEPTPGASHPTDKWDADAPATAAGLPPFRDYIFTRLGGAGIAKPLWECVLCGSAVSDRARHDGWHKDRNRRLFRA